MVGKPKDPGLIDQPELDAYCQPLLGLRLLSVSKLDYTWIFRFADGSLVLTESSWRLVADKAVRTSSEDHGQQFGLPAPVDAAKRVSSKIGRGQIVAASISAISGDLVIEFKGGVVLQFLQMSAGYEAWTLVLRGDEYHCVGGGHISRGTAVGPTGSR